MTTDSRNYTGQGAVGAVLQPGFNAAGVPKTTGPNVAGADVPPNETLPDYEVTAQVQGLARNPTATVGPTNLACSSNGTVTADAAYLAAVDALAARGASFQQGVVLLP